MDLGRQYRQDELPADVFNAGNGDTKNFNGQQVRVQVNSNGTRNLIPISPQEQAMQYAQQAQQMQVQANQPAIQTLQGQQTSLSQTYKDLLASILNQGSVALNTATTGENNLLAQRGITNDSPLYASQLSQAQQSAQAQTANQAAQVNASQQEGLSGLAAQIAGLQAGNVGQSLGFAGNQSGLQNALQIAQIQQPLINAQARQANFVPIPGYGIYDTTNKQLIGGLNGVPGQGATNVNGVPSLYIP